MERWIKAEYGLRNIVQYLGTRTPLLDRGVIKTQLEST